MKFESEKKYLVLPVSSHAVKKKVCFYNEEGKCIYDVEMRLDPVTPERDVYLDMQRFGGRTLEVKVSPEIKFEIRMKDKKPLARFDERLRPNYHFTAAEGWINDPNGLVYADGVYHLFYQLNPCGTEWGNMHWGHAVSKNLADWEYQPIALFPDNSGTMFSGGAICDDKNILGYKYSEKTPIVLFYTAAGSTSEASKEEKFTQCMAVSSDGGETFAKYPSNPIIPHIQAENRDPKVVYFGKHEIYVMSLYLCEDKYAVFTSKNLKNWEKIFEISLPEDNECPAFFPLENSEGVEKWIFMGAHDRYITGCFDGKEFSPDTDNSLVFNYTPENAYAAQRFENADGCIRMIWLKTDFAKYGMPFNGAMSFPQELKLICTDEGDRLTVFPIAQAEKLHTKKAKLNHEGSELSLSLYGIGQDISVEINPKNAKEAEVSVFGTKFVINFENETLTSGKTVMDFAKTGDIFKMRLLCDTSGIEVYLSDGLSYGAFIEIPDASLDTFKICADSNIKVKVQAFRMRKSRKADRRK